MEFYEGKSSYFPYFSKELEVVTCNYNVSEVYGKLLSRNDLEGAKKIAEVFMPDSLIPSNEALLGAQRLKLELRELSGKSVSLIDSLGYLMAKSMRLKFLTGDDAFKGLKNVEFVK